MACVVAARCAFLGSRRFPLILRSLCTTNRISEYAEQKLGDIVFLELPEKDHEVHAHGRRCGVVESVKAVSEIYSPASGKVIEVNPALEDNTAIINKSPMDEGEDTHELLYFGLFSSAQVGVASANGEPS
ncbi:unnamed protein product [Echinostoma caproni]|uniref:Lipoyl-binding domain-containing protein n=1 Tax=Echinostoma caproni TaxID=27848 RepID=A0A183BGV4_9TREM|nr:unnamed protein product [Echinostoma caproni]